MTDQFIKPHDLARAAIDSWRGHCLDLFARGEKIIGRTLEILREKRGQEFVKLRHLGGQRSDDLAKVLTTPETFGKHGKSAASILSSWREHEIKRAFLAHSVATVTLDSQGHWFCVFDMTVYKADVAQPDRWTVTAVESAVFAADLEKAMGVLRSQLGQIRKCA